VNPQPDVEQDIIFDSHTNRVARAVFIKGNEVQVTPEVLRELEQLPFRVSEMLMHHEGICFSVYGENMIAPLLFRYFGSRGLQNRARPGNRCCPVAYRTPDDGRANPEFIRR
jgi:hypothetical protein